MYEQFDYRCPASQSELLALLGQGGQGTLLYGGGTDLLVVLRARKVSAEHLIDTKGVPEFRAVTETETAVSIGCAVTLSQIESDPLVRRWAPALADGAGKVGSVQIRNKGTLAGNIQTASPAGDGFNAAYGLDGSVVLLSAAGVRRLPLDQFVQGPRKTALAPGELIAVIEIPKRSWTFQRFFKVGRRNALAISVVNGLVALEMEDGAVKDARISVGAVGPTPLRIREAESLLKGRFLTPELAERVSDLVQNSVHPISDLRASAEYRAYMAGVMVKRQLKAYMEESGT